MWLQHSHFASDTSEVTRHAPSLNPQTPRLSALRWRLPSDTSDALGDAGRVSDAAGALSAYAGRVASEVPMYSDVHVASQPVQLPPPRVPVASLRVLPT